MPEPGGIIVMFLKAFEPHYEKINKQIVNPILKYSIAFVKHVLVLKLKTSIGNKVVEKLSFKSLFSGKKKTIPKPNPPPPPKLHLLLPKDLLTLDFFFIWGGGGQGMEVTFLR